MTAHLTLILEAVRQIQVDMRELKQSQRDLETRLTDQFDTLAKRQEEVEGRLEATDDRLDAMLHYIAFVHAAAVGSGKKIDRLADLIERRLP